MLLNILDYFSRKSRIEITALGIVLAIIMGFLDYLTGYEVAFSIFYLVPVFFVAWFAGIWLALIVSVLSAAIWLLADILAGHTYSSPLIPFWNFVTRLGFFLLASYVATVISKLLEREKELVRLDSLTGVSNRRYFTEITAKELRRAQRYRRPITLAYMDIDNFKEINDRSGHSTGDALLGVFSETIKKNIRITDLIARLGGDEFAILMPETRSEHAKAAMSKVQKVILESMQRHGWTVTVSVGVVTCNDAPCSVDELIKMADNLMYSAKNDGKNIIKYVVL